MTVDPESRKTEQLRAYAAVLAWFRRRVPDEDTARDLAQRTWMRFRAWQNGRPGVLPDNLTAFLLNQAEWVRCDYYAERCRLRTTELLAGDTADVAAIEDGRLLASVALPSSLANVIHSIDLGRAMAALPAKKRRALVLMFVDDLETFEIAPVIGVSTRRVNQMINEAIAALGTSRHLAGYSAHKGGHR